MRLIYSPRPPHSMAYIRVTGQIITNSAHVGQAQQSSYLLIFSHRFIRED